VEGFNVTIGNGGLAHDYPTSLTDADVGKFVAFDDVANELVVQTTPQSIGAGVLLGVRSVNGNTLGRAAFDGPVSIKAAFQFVGGQFASNNALGEAIKHLVVVPPQPALAIATGPTVNGFVPAFLLGTSATSGAGGPSATPYIVAKVGAPFTEIQDAIEQAFADGHVDTTNPALVLVGPGTFVGDVNMRKGINVQGATRNRGFSTIIQGTVTVDLTAGQVRDLTHCALSDINVQPAAGNGIDFIGVNPQKLYVNNVDIELGAGFNLNMQNSGLEAGVRRSQVIAASLHCVRSAAAAGSAIEKNEGNLYWSRGECTQLTTTNDAIANKGNGSVQIDNVEINGIYRQTGTTTTGVLAAVAIRSAGTPIVQAGTLGGTLALLQVLVTGGVNPVIGGGAGFVFWSNITYGAAAFTTFSAALNGGGGAPAGKLPVEP